VTTIKDVAWSFFELINRGRLADAYAVFDDSGTWWNSLDRKILPMVRMKEVGQRIIEKMPLKFSLINLFQDGNVVIIECESHLVLADDRLYNNVYTFMFTFRDNKVMHVREHADTKYTVDMLSKEIWDVQ